MILNLGRFCRTPNLWSAHLNGKKGLPVYLTTNSMGNLQFLWAAGWRPRGERNFRVKTVRFFGGKQGAWEFCNRRKLNSGNAAASLPWFAAQGDCRWWGSSQWWRNPAPQSRKHVNVSVQIAVVNGICTSLAQTRASTLFSYVATWMEKKSPTFRGKKERGAGNLLDLYNGMMFFGSEEHGRWGRGPSCCPKCSQGSQPFPTPTGEI